MIQERLKVCQRGHNLELPNALVVRGGNRRCRECRKMKQAARYKRYRALEIAAKAAQATAVTSTVPVPQTPSASVTEGTPSGSLFPLS